MVSIVSSRSASCAATSGRSRARGRSARPVSCAASAAVKPGDTVLVAGATGGVGQILTKKLVERGFFVKALSRSKEKSREMKMERKRERKVERKEGGIKKAKVVSLQGVVKVKKAKVKKAKVKKGRALADAEAPGASGSANDPSASASASAAPKIRVRRPWSER